MVGTEIGGGTSVGGICCCIDADGTEMVGRSTRGAAIGTIVLGDGFVVRSGRVSDEEDNDACKCFGVLPFEVLSLTSPLLWQELHVHSN